MCGLPSSARAGSSAPRSSTSSRRGHEVVAFDRAALDITDDRAVAAAMDARAAGRDRQLRGYNAVDAAEDHPVDALDVNAFAVRALARRPRRIGATLVHYSSDFVFDGAASTPYTEDDRPNPRSVYAASKLLGEWFAADAPRALRAAGREPVRPCAGRAPAKGSVAAIVERVAGGRRRRRCSRTGRCRRPTSSTPRARRGSCSSAGAPPGLYHCVNSRPLHLARARARSGAAAGRRAAARCRCGSPT